MQKHDIDIAARVQFAAAISTQRDQTHGKVIASAAHFYRGARRGENVLEQNVDQLRAACAHLAPAATGLMAQTQPVIFDLKKPLVTRQEFGRLLRLWECEFAR